MEWLGRYNALSEGSTSWWLRRKQDLKREDRAMTTLRSCVHQGTAEIVFDALVTRKACTVVGPDAGMLVAESDHASAAVFGVVSVFRMLDCSEPKAHES